MSPTAILTLLWLAAVAQFFGTTTVAVNYTRGHLLGRSILLELRDEAEARDGNRISSLLERSDAQLGAPLLEATEGTLNELRSRVAHQLRGNWLLTAGIISYFAGAALGLAAGLGSLTN